jgi:3-oxoacyl-[acyl-carrier protein] reductase
MQLGLEGRVALVCGSTRGLGRAVAKALGQEGARLAVNGRQADSTERAARELAAETGQPVLAVPGDVGVAGEPERMVERVQHELGRVDIVFCNAGGPPAAPFRDQPAEAWQRAIDVNLLSAVHLARAAVPLMRKRQWGRIICLASIAAKQPVPGLILSTTARAGLLGFAKSLSDEVAPDGITVNVVCPGYIATERVVELNRARAKREQRTSEEIAREVIRDIPLGRMGNPEEFAAAVAFLASERAGYITGAVLQVDGGYTRSIF